MTGVTPASMLATRKPHIGDIALCSRGSLGLLTEDEPREITYPDGQKGVAYVGIHLTNRIALRGAPWSSRTPRVLSNINELLLIPSHEFERQRYRMPKCPHCHRRPELVVSRAEKLEAQIQPNEDATLAIPVYEVFPCCSAKYVKTVEGPTRLQKIRMAEQAQEAEEQAERLKLREERKKGAKPDVQR